MTGITAHVKRSLLLGCTVNVLPLVLPLLTYFARAVIRGFWPVLHTPPQTHVYAMNIN